MTRSSRSAILYSSIWRRSERGLLVTGIVTGLDRSLVSMRGR